MKKITLFLSLTISFFALSGCDKDSVEAYSVGFETTTQAFDINFAATRSSHEVLITTSNVSSTDRFFNVKVSSASTALFTGYDVPTAIRLPANNNSVPLVVDILDANGTTYPVGEVFTLVLEIIERDTFTIAGSAITLNIERQPCSFPEIKLDILFDGYGSESTWKITDSSNTVIDSGGPYSDGQAAYTQKFCIPNGTYTFEIFDTWGDGLSYPANGHAKISVDGNEAISIDGNFGYSGSDTFTF